jgi:hypothetical protein
MDMILTYWETLIYLAIIGFMLWRGMAVIDIIVAFIIAPMILLIVPWMIFETVPAYVWQGLSILITSLMVLSQVFPKHWITSQPSNTRHQH